jgi:hypothetical protein
MLGVWRELKVLGNACPEMYPHPVQYMCIGERHYFRGVET